jgi:hypothetical protein
MINIGGNISKINKGQESINRVYVGDELVWQKHRPVAIIDLPSVEVNKPEDNWLHLHSGTPYAAWPTNTNRGLVKVGSGEIKAFTSNKRGVDRTFDYGEVVIQDSVGNDAGNLVITFESQLRADHDINKRNLELILTCDDADISAFQNNPIVAGEVIALPRREETTTSGIRWISYGQYPDSLVTSSYSGYRDSIKDHLPIDTSSLAGEGICVANTSNMSDTWRERRDHQAKNNFQISFTINASSEWYDKNFTLHYRHAEGAATWNERITFNTISYTDYAKREIAIAEASGIAQEDIYVNATGFFSGNIPIGTLGTFDPTDVVSVAGTTIEVAEVGQGITNVITAAADVSTEDTQVLQDSQGSVVVVKPLGKVIQAMGIKNLSAK